HHELQTSPGFRPARRLSCWPACQCLAPAVGAPSRRPRNHSFSSQAQQPPLAQIGARNAVATSFEILMAKPRHLRVVVTSTERLLSERDGERGAQPVPRDFVL